MFIPIKILDYVSGSNREEDLLDRVNYRITTTLLIIGALAIFAKEYGGSPIQCFTMAEWKSGWVQYAHDICMIEDTYYVPMNQMRVPKNSEVKKDMYLGYYQWVPFILIGQALFFLVPNLLWKIANYYVSGIEVRAIISMASDTRKTEVAAEDCRKACTTIAQHLHYALEKKFEGENNILGHSKKAISQRTLTILYLFIKFLYIANGVLQFMFMSYALGKRSHFWGFSSLSTLKEGQWNVTGLFPRVTMCDFPVRALTGGNRIDEYTVQCVLTGNMLNEKIFTFLYYWFIALILCTSASFLYFLYPIFIASTKENFIKHHLIAYAKQLRYQIKDRKEKWLNNSLHESIEEDDYCIRSDSEDVEETSKFQGYLQCNVIALTDEERRKNGSKSRANHQAILYKYPTMTRLQAFRIFIQKIGGNNTLANVRNPKLPLRYKFKGGMQINENCEKSDLHTNFTFYIEQCPGRRPIIHNEPPVNNEEDFGIESTTTSDGRLTPSSCGGNGSKSFDPNGTMSTTKMQTLDRNAAVMDELTRYPILEDSIQTAISTLIQFPEMETVTEESERYFIEINTDEYDSSLSKLINISDAYEEAMYSYGEEFNNFIGDDGILMLKLMAQNSNPYFTSAVIGFLFTKYSNKRRKNSSLKNGI